MRALALAAGLLCLSLPARAQQPHPVTDRLTLSPGESHQLAFRLERAAMRELTLPAVSSDPTVLSVGPRLSFLPGHRLAFLELTPLRAGQVWVAVGRGSCRVRVLPVDRQRGPRVRIVSPGPGAVLWGRVRALARATGSAPIRRMRLEIDGRIAAEARGRAEIAHAIDARARAGARRIEVIATDALGRTGRAALRVTFGAPGGGLDREAEALAGPMPPYSPLTPRIRADATARGGRLATLYRDAHEMACPVTVARPGFYQAILRARGGDRIHPWVELLAGRRMLASGPVTTRTRLARHALGAPFELSPGAHRLTLFFRNMEDRRLLDLDRVEIRRVGDRLPDVSPPQAVLFCDAVGGELGGAALLWASARDDGEVASIELRIDGVTVAARAGRELVYRLPADALLPGRHAVRALARDAAGNVGASRRLVLRRLPYHGAGPDGTWVQPDSRALQDPGALGGRSWTLRGGQTLRVPVRIRRQGRYEVRLLARAGRPRAVRVGAATVTVDSPTHRFGAASLLQLGPGAHRLAVTPVDPDPARTLRLVGLALVERRTDDRSAPWAEIVAPRRGERVAPGEMVVVRASDNDRVARVELLVDGRVVSRSGRGGLCWVWLHGAGLADGVRRLQLRVVDRSGNVGWSAARPVLLRRGGALSPSERGTHLLQRLGLGYNPRELAVLLRDGEPAWLARQLAGDLHADDRAAYLATELWLPATPRQLRLSALAFQRHTTNPLRERLTLFFDNHFSTWIGKTGMLREWGERDRYRRLALGGFGRLLRASASSPAMLTFLDNTRNRKGSLNENYGRELLELHTLGSRAGYTQRDVEEVSRIFTGWSVARTDGHPWWTVRFSPADHDDGRKQVLGVRFGPGRDGEDARRLLAILAAHPATSRRLSRKLVRALVADDPPAPLVAAAERAYLAGAGQLRPVLEALLAAPGFFDRRHLGAKLADPQRLVVGLSRARLGFDQGGLDEALVGMGQPLFGCDSPEGWPDRREAWLGASALLARWNFAEQLAARLPLDAPPDADRGRLIDDLAMALLGRPLGRASRRAVLGSSALTPRRLAALVLQMPEAQRR